MLKSFGLKFVDVMLGIILGLGFQWWPEIRESWGYVAFIFVYLNLIDYWIDYSPTLKKYPLKDQLDILLHTAIIFSMFFIVYSTVRYINIFFLAYAFYRIVDILWIWRMITEYKPLASDMKFMKTWITSDFFETFMAIFLALIYIKLHYSPMTLLLIYISCRILSRVWASLRYKKMFYQSA